MESIFKTNLVVLPCGTKVKSAILCCDVFDHKSFSINGFIFGYRSGNEVVRIIIDHADDAYSELAVYLHVPVDGWIVNRAIQGDVLTQLCLYLSQVLCRRTNQKHWEDHPKQIHDQVQKQEKPVWDPELLCSGTSSSFAADKVLFTSSFTRWLYRF